MPTIELSIRPRQVPAAETAAWYLPGGSPREWLATIASWSIDHLAVRVVVLRESDNETLAGALAILPEGSFAVGGRCVPFQRFGDNVYLPLDAEIFPSVTAAEADGLFSSEFVYVWLPGRGLTAAEPGEVFGVCDLIEPPRRSPVTWNCAVTGMAFPRRIAALLPSETHSADAIIDEGRGEIGTRGDEIQNLPRSPNEPLSGVAGALGRAAILGAAAPLWGLGKALSAIGKLVPGAGVGAGVGGTRAASGSAPGMAGLGALADKMLARVSKSIEQMRHKEVNRLLHMLESDPDEGLKFAIPFGGGDHRGIAPPSHRLGARDVNFSLRRLGGGAAADFWDMSAEHRRKLFEMYRELAAREVRLGRHRRAAYVYAELLGDLSSAASALEQGGHYREAAVIYRDRLNNDNAAAECLERGGLWNEAIEAYRELGRHEKVGDLLTHIEQSEAAAEAYRTAVAECRSMADLLDAARIYEEKLHDVGQALETLDSAWPDAAQAIDCVTMSFSMRGRLGHHEAARARIQRLAEDAERTGRHADVAELLATVFEKYPDQTTREEAAEKSRGVVVNRMERASRADAERFVRTLARLAPEDRLLRRDGRRFIGQKFAQRVSQPARPVPRTGRRQKLQLVHRFSLGLGPIWKAATTFGGNIYVAGIQEGVVFARYDRAGNIEKNLNPWKRIRYSEQTPLVLLPGRSTIAVFPIGQKPLPTVQLFAHSDSPTLTAVRAGTPKGHGVTWGAASGALGNTWAIEARDDPVLACVDENGSVVATHSLLPAMGEPFGEVIPIPMHATSRRVFLGAADRLLSFKGGECEEVEQCPNRIVRVTGGQPYSATVVAASLEDGAVVMRLGFGGYVHSVCAAMHSPELLFNKGGFLIGADENRIEVYELARGGSASNAPSLRGETGHLSGRPIAVLPTAHTNQFTVVTEQGVGSTYELLA